MIPLLQEVTDPRVWNEEKGRGEFFADLYCFAALGKFSVEPRELEPISQELLSLKRFVFSNFGEGCRTKEPHIIYNHQDRVSYSIIWVNASPQLSPKHTYTHKHP